MSSSAETGAGAELPTPALRERDHDQLVSLLDREVDTPWVLLLAFLLGALHALSPGHGKALVAAYLVGQRGTVLHASLLGLVVTFTHVASVLLLGIVALWASERVGSETLSSVLSVASGVLIVVVGLGLVRSRLRAREHHHDHDHHHHDHDHHHHDHDEAHHEHHHHHAPSGSLGAILWLGISGGLVPCPSALVVLLLAISLGRIAEGMALIVAFSLGLAAVLVTVGILVVRARALVDRVLPERSRLLTALPTVSAVIVTIVGVVVTVRGILAL